MARYFSGVSVVRSLRNVDFLRDRVAGRPAVALPSTGVSAGQEAPQPLRFLVPGKSVSAVARRNGVAPNLLFRWRRLMDEGGAMAVGSNEPVVGASKLALTLRSGFVQSPVGVTIM